jgi:putative FmdB family regulatory protein
MPIYEYECEDCGTRHEKLVMAKGQEIVCPKCASGKQTIQILVFSASTKSGGGAVTSSSDVGGCGCSPRGCGCN